MFLFEYIYIYIYIKACFLGKQKHVNKKREF